MAEPVFILRLLAPDGTMEEHDVVSVTAPGELGYLGILAHHVPLVTTLTRGGLIWRAPDGLSHHQEIPGGLLEVRQDRVTVLTASPTAATRPA